MDGGERRGNDEEKSKEQEDWWLNASCHMERRVRISDSIAHLSPHQHDEAQHKALLDIPHLPSHKKLRTRRRNFQFVRFLIRWTMLFSLALYHIAHPPNLNSKVRTLAHRWQILEMGETSLNPRMLACDNNVPTRPVERYTDFGTRHGRRRTL